MTLDCGTYKYISTNKDNLYSKWGIVRIALLIHLINSFILVWGGFYRKMTRGKSSSHYRKENDYKVPVTIS